jgi:hypothetical protein
MTVTQNTERQEGGNERTYLIALILIQNFIIVYVKTLPTEVANQNKIWFEISISLNIFSSIILL